MPSVGNRLLIDCAQGGPSLRFGMTGVMGTDHGLCDGLAEALMPEAQLLRSSLVIPGFA